MNPESRVHIHIAVSNLERSKVFYSKLFGAAPVKERPGYAKFLPDIGPLNLALSQGAVGPERGLVRHVGIQVGSSDVVRRELARVEAEGIPVRVEMDVDCCHANQDKFWAIDPDHVEWEVYHLNRDLPEEETAVPAGEACEDHVCCASLAPEARSGASATATARACGGGDASTSRKRI